MKNKKLGIALLTLTIFTNACAKKDSGVHQPKSPWPFVVVEDVVVGTAGVLTLGQTDADPTALPMTIPDAIPGVSYARTKDNSDESLSSEESASEKKARVKKEAKEKRTEKKKESTKKEKSSDSKTKTAKKPRVKKTKSNDSHPAEVIVLPVTVAADIVTLDTQHFTRKTVDSINGDSDTE